MVTENNASELFKEVSAKLKISAPRKYEVTQRDIRHFCQAIGLSEPTPDKNHHIVAPPLFCQVFMFEDVPLSELPTDGSPKEIDIPIPAERTVGGGSDFSIFYPVKAGDSISVQSNLKDISIKEGKSGPLYLIQVETIFTNQINQIVAKEIATYVKRK